MPRPVVDALTALPTFFLSTLSTKNSSNDCGTRHQRHHQHVLVIEREIVCPTNQQLCPVAAVLAIRPTLQVHYSFSGIGHTSPETVL